MSRKTIEKGYTVTCLGVLSAMMYEGYKVSLGIATEIATNILGNKTLGGLNK